MNASATPTLLSFGCVAMALLGCDFPAGNGPNEMIEVVLGESVFLIPSANSPERASPSWIDLVPGLDDGSRSASLVFRVGELTHQVPEYRSQTDLFATLTALTPDESVRAQNPPVVGDIWFGRGRYRNRAFESLGDTGFFRVYDPTKARRVFWDVIRTQPDPGASPPAESSDFWIASCTVMTGTNRSGTLCKTRLTFDDLLVEFGVDEQDLSVIDGLNDLIKKRIRGWRRN